MVPVTELVSVKRRTTQAGKCANARALSASRDAADSRAQASTDAQRELIPVFLPEASTMRRAAVIVVDPSPVGIPGIPASRLAISSDRLRRRAVVLCTSTALIPIVETLSISRLFF